MTLPAFIFAALMSALPPCPFEDSTNCAWDASEQGNGQGRDFVSLAGILIVEGSP